MHTFTKALHCGLTQIPNTDQISEVLEVVQSQRFSHPATQLDYLHSQSSEEE